MTKKFDRVKVLYENKSSDYVVTNDNINDNCFRKQFYFLYCARINLLTPRILKNARNLIDSQLQITQLTDASRSDDCLIIGVILKKMKYRRSVLFDFQDEEINFEFREKLLSKCLVSDEDVLEFEGDQQIVKLTGNIDKDQFVTGNVIGLYGRITTDDLFDVKNVIFPVLAPQITWPLIESDCYVAFLSGLSLNCNIAENKNVLYALDKLSNWLCAEVELSEEEFNIVQNISRLVIAGDSIRISTQNVETPGLEFLNLNQDVDKDAIGQFDKFLTRLVSNIHVDLMSGANDPTSILLPQQPIPRLIFPWARRFGKLLNTVTNPYKFCLNGIVFLGTSGQNIHDLSRLTLGQSPLELMRDCLLRSHIFPTVPDSVDGFPFQKSDPFIVNDMPHVFFTGNQEHLGQMWINLKKQKTFESTSAEESYKKTLLLTIPKFSNNLSLILLNLKNMKVSEYDFTQKKSF